MILSLLSILSCPSMPYESEMVFDKKTKRRELETKWRVMGLDAEKRYYTALMRPEQYPDFDLDRELQNPEFLRYTSPEVGQSVEQAFYALHHDAILQQQADVIARKVKADAAASIRSGVRPRENGSSASAAVQSTPDLKHMTREERLAYIKGKYGPG